MSGLGEAASVIALIQITQSLLNYLISVKSASKEQTRLAAEAAAALSLLIQLDDRVKEAKSGDIWLTSVAALGAANGPLAQYHGSLQRLAPMLAESRTFGGEMVHALTWTFKKDDIQDLFRCIESVKSTVAIALSSDHL